MYRVLKDARGLVAKTRFRKFWLNNLNSLFMHSIQENGTIEHVDHDEVLHLVVCH